MPPLRSLMGKRDPALARPHVYALAAVFAAALITIGAVLGQTSSGTAHASHLSDKVQLFRSGFSHQPLPLPAGAVSPGSRSRVARAADNAARELAGSGDISNVSWNPNNGLWARAYHPDNVARNWRAPIWWQSAIALEDLASYLQSTGNAQPAYEELIARTYRMGLHMPNTDSPYGFANMFMDDTGWWGMAWLQTATYELTVRHAVTEALSYLHVSEYDANYMYRAPRVCGGIVWQLRYAPDTTSGAEFVTLAARLARVLDGPGPFHDAAAGRRFLAQARQTLRWMVSRRLVNLRSGKVLDHLKARCTPGGGPLTYTEGEMADALVGLGQATGKPAYYREAARFINWVLAPSSGMMDGSVLQQPCEPLPGRCSHLPHAYDAEAYKGIFVGAVSDWTRATGRLTYARFLLDQAHAVLTNAASDAQTATSCTDSPHDCQLGFYWARRIPPERWPLLATPGTQTSGLVALTAALGVIDQSRRSTG